VRLGELNAMEAPEAARALRGCADVERWVAALLVRRPYADRRTLLDTAHLLATWSDAELDHALADPPASASAAPARPRPPPPASRPV